MIRHFVLLDDPLDPITDEHLYAASHDDGVKGARIIRERGVLPYGEIEIEHPGWGIYAPGEPRAAAIVVSEDGTMATASVRARGWLKALPSELDGDTVTLHLECSAKDVDIRKEVTAAAVIGAHAEVTTEFSGQIVTVDPTADSLPYDDRLWGRLQKTSDDVLQGRHAWWDFGILDHQVTLRDHADYARTLNVGDGYDPTSLRREPGGGAAKQVRWKAHVDFVTRSSGTCDIAGRISPLSSILGYAAQAPRSLGANVGWSIGTPVVVKSNYETEPLWTGQTFRAVLRSVRYVQTNVTPIGTTTPQYRTDTQYGASYTAVHEPYVTLQAQNIHFTSWPCQWNYQQQRRETIEMILDVPCQDVFGVQDFIDLGEIGLGNVYTIDGIESAGAVDNAKEYSKDDHVFEGGRLYRASADVVGFYAWQKRGRVGGSFVRREEWVDTGIDVPLADDEALTFVELARGLGSVAHGFRRMRVKALEALASYRVTLTIRREDLPDVELTDRVRVLLPGKPGEAMKPAFGRVLRIEEQLGHDGDTVTLTLAIPTGTGATEKARPARLSGLAGNGYFGGSYRAGPTEWMTSGDDIEWTLDADDLDAPVDPKLLSSWGYSVIDVEYSGSASQQAAAFLNNAIAGLPPTSLGPQDATQVGLLMRPLKSTRLIERTFRARGTLLTSPRGIDLTGDGEP